MRGTPRQAQFRPYANCMYQEISTELLIRLFHRGVNINNSRGQKYATALRATLEFKSALRLRDIESLERLHNLC